MNEAALEKKLAAFDEMRDALENELHIIQVACAIGTSSVWAEQRYVQVHVGLTRLASALALAKAAMEAP